MKSQQELFDDLFKDTIPEKYDEAVKKLRIIACEKTRDMREARDDAFRAYTRLSNAYNLCWREAWKTARDTMIVRGG